MHIINIKLILFDNFTNIKSEPLTVSKILQSFAASSINAMPTVFQAITANPNGMFKKEDRMSFIDNLKKISLIVPADSIQIEKEYSVSDFESLNDKVTDFTHDSSQILTAFLNGTGHQVNATRLSIITNVMIDQNQISDISKVYNAFNVDFGTYNKDVTFEWSNRAVKKSNATSINEELNDVTEILRVQGVMNKDDIIEEIDTIQIKLDLNTLQINTTRRFDKSAIESFMTEVSQIALNKIISLSGQIL